MIKRFKLQKLQTLFLAIPIIILALVYSLHGAAAAGSLSVSGITTASSGDSAWNLSGDTATVSVASGGLLGNSKKSSTLILTNSSGSNAVMYFSYAITNKGSIDITVSNGTHTDTGSAIEAILSAGGSVTVKATSASFSKDTCTATISSIKLEVAPEAQLSFTSTVGGSAAVKDSSGKSLSLDTQHSYKVGSEFTLTAYS